ncbi:MAG TPA: sugar-binding domain-containing protein [Amaricoccus sp.]|uniref:sugar-binding domain-containing protein n=1 Tax=Amaricoccus sp. TaxID=1872485 RepID=UPI002BBB91E4|nr:sugar-binding domain-containing protein [Amaricoccus sp.]HMQ95115.1 sugar-binding domain-containing protein [Amaricoccus sp.]HMR53293.1 sugar-binding domain-containing protein [Amaricoccus sp.]HMU00244.1 sugar-binding domain-containing protein [Amaricoccus sp.]
MLDVKKLPFDERAKCAAYMRASYNMSQLEIGTVLGGLSQPQVSRLLAQAEQKGYLVVEQRFARELFSDEWIQMVDRLLMPSGLFGELKDFCRRHGVCEPRLRAFESGPGHTEVRMAQRRTRLGRLAAGRMVELIEKSRIVGVAWGRTIKSVVEGIQASRLPITASERIEFAAVCAELVSLAQHGYSSSILAGALSEIFNGEPGSGPQLTGFPAYVPRHYAPDMRQSIWRFVRETPGHRRVFSGAGALIHRMDMLLSSVGSTSRPVLGSFDELVAAAGIPAERITTLVAGDLGGILIPRANLSPDETRLVDDLNEMWTGLHLDHVRDIAARGDKDPATAGVVVVAVGAGRAGVILELIRGNLVNEVIMDHAGANELRTLIAAETVDAGTG